MIGLAFALIGYLFASTGYLGGDLIYALDVMENWYWIVLVLVSIVSIIIVLFFTLGGVAVGASVSRNVGGIAGMFFGAGFGILTGAAVLFRTILQLWLINWLMGSIDPHAASLDVLTTNQWIGLAGLVLLAMIPSKSSDSKSK